MSLGVSAKMGVANRRAFVNVMMNVFRPFQNLRRESTFVCTCVSLETNAVEMKYGRIPRGNHVSFQTFESSVALCRLQKIQRAGKVSKATPCVIQDRQVEKYTRK